MPAVDEYDRVETSKRHYTDLCESVPPRRSASVSGGSEPASFGTVHETIRSDHYEPTVCRERRFAPATRGERPGQTFSHSVGSSDCRAWSPCRYSEGGWCRSRDSGVTIVPRPGWVSRRSVPRSLVGVPGLNPLLDDRTRLGRLWRAVVQSVLSVGRRAPTGSGDRCRPPDGGVRHGQRAAQLRPAANRRLRHGELAPPRRGPGRRRRAFASHVVPTALLTIAFDAGLLILGAFLVYYSSVWKSLRRPSVIRTRRSRGRQVTNTTG